MSGSLERLALSASIEQTEELISRQSALISDRAADGKPTDALAPILDEMKGNLHLLHKVQQFLDTGPRRRPRQE
jgi:hypothetical protein